jgi:hypothetical protein
MTKSESFEHRSPPHFVPAEKSEGNAMAGMFMEQNS